MIIAVIGGETSSSDEETAAYETGLEIARRGHVLICGGRQGVMREACRGARNGGGHTIGILPGEDRSDMNEFVEFPIVTGMGFARNTIIARTADALVAIGGRYGTLSEIAFAFISGRPVAGIGTWALSLPSGELAPIASCRNAREAIDYCERAVAARE
ncbi:MAG: TIGR00725 family protein [Dehalococcoidia bacterium]|nr:TIGR00725 family protein [Chloroflexi bacterium CFX7]MCK6564717.1 TIGR00725 family protein [Dehalococcoidia bacterium]NUQ54381.1 TIGR00725 family protein [Dehalococcoidia bacterium]RIL04331.1 MAG: TIGR00725 family protein [bacterium]